MNAWTHLKRALAAKDANAVATALYEAKEATALSSAAVVPASASSLEKLVREADGFLASSFDSADAVVALTEAVAADKQHQEAERLAGDDGHPVNWA